MDNLTTSQKIIPYINSFLFFGNTIILYITTIYQYSSKKKNENNLKIWPIGEVYYIKRIVEIEFWVQCCYWPLIAILKIISWIKRNKKLGNVIQKKLIFLNFIITLGTSIITHLAFSCFDPINFILSVYRINFRKKKKILKILIFSIIFITSVIFYSFLFFPYLIAKFYFIITLTIGSDKDLGFLDKILDFVTILLFLRNLAKLNLSYMMNPDRFEWINRMTMDKINNIQINVENYILENFGIFYVLDYKMNNIFGKALLLKKYRFKFYEFDPNKENSLADNDLKDGIFISLFT